MYLKEAVAKGSVPEAVGETTRYKSSSITTPALALIAHITACVKFKSMYLETEVSLV